MQISQTASILSRSMIAAYSITLYMIRTMMNTMAPYPISVLIYPLSI